MIQKQTPLYGQKTSKMQSQIQAEEQCINQVKTKNNGAVKSEEKRKEFKFSFDDQKEIDNELRMPRSRAYMEMFDAIDMLSATDEEIIAELKSNMDAETAEEFSNMTDDEILEEIKLSFQEEFQNLKIEVKSIMCGVLAKCYIDGCDCHSISSDGDIIDHYNEREPIPDENLERGRKVFKKYPHCRCVEVYTDCCRVISNDSTVIKIPNGEIE